MADNTTLNSGSGGDVIATDEIEGVKHQRVKLQYGEDGTAFDVSYMSPLPVGQDNHDSLNVNANLQVGDTDVDGSSNPVPVGQDNHDNLNVNANLQIGDADVDGTSNPVPVGQDNHDNLNVNANLQVDDVDVGNSNPVPIGFIDGFSLDAFSRLRVSNPRTVFDSSFRYDLLPIRYNSITANSGTITHLTNESSAELATAASAGSSAILQSKEYHKYIPGKSQLILITGVIRTAVSNVVKRVGYFDDNDGIFLEQNGTTDVAFVRRTSTTGSQVDNRVTQNSWNIDTFDGNGPSGITLDLTKCYVLVIDLQWLGMGRVRVGFDIDGMIYYAHQFLNANNLTTVYMKKPDLPIRWEMSGDSVSTMQATCATVISEGGSEEEGFSFSAGTNLTARTVTAGTPLPVIAIRPAATFNSISNHSLFELESCSWLPTSGTADYRWQVVYNPTITGGSWSSVDSTNSAAEINRTGTSLSGGIVIDSGYDNASNSQSTIVQFQYIKNRFPWCVDASGNQIVIALVYSDVSGTTDIQATMKWKELR